MRTFLFINDALADIMAERERQISECGFDSAHDDKAKGGELFNAGMVYRDSGLRLLNPAHAVSGIPNAFPWAASWWKPTTPRRDMVKAGALVMADMNLIARQGGPTKHRNHWLGVIVAEIAEMDAKALSAPSLDEVV